MMQARFIIVGSGWRAGYYIRIAKTLPDYFKLEAVLVRSEEKKAEISKEYGVYATFSIDECFNMKPDFIVVAVNKTSIAKVSIEWLNRGFTVLCETPAGLDIETLCELWKLKCNNAKLAVAEQYIRYPEINALLKITKTGIIGEPYALNISIAHEYHAASLIREFLKINNEMFTISANTFSMPTRETITRYERIKDVRLSNKSRCIATIEFENNKFSIYDFNSEQYRSPIRNNTIKIQGEKGEIIDNRVYYLDDKNNAYEEDIKTSYRQVKRSCTNPNFEVIKEIEEITFKKESLYIPPFGLKGLSSDETAIAQTMYDVFLYSKDQKEPDYPLEKALTDCYMAILLNQSVSEKRVVKSELMPWM